MGKRIKHDFRLLTGGGPAARFMAGAIDIPHFAVCLTAAIVRVFVSPSAGGTFLGGQKSTQKSQPAAITAAAGIARLSCSATVHLATEP